MNYQAKKSNVEKECNEYSVYTGDDKVANYKIGP